MGSTNGTYVDHTYDRKKQVNLMHGGEVQLGELRLKLVTFTRDSGKAAQARAGVPSPSATDSSPGSLARDQAC